MREGRNDRALLSIEKEALVLHLIKCLTKDKEPEKVCSWLLLSDSVGVDMSMQPQHVTIISFKHA